MKLNCVILNYNDAATTTSLVQAIGDYKILQQIIIVDNASTDDSMEVLKALENHKVTVISAGRNGGYGAGNNLGVRYAVEHNQATHVLIANPDVMFTERCIAHLLQIFRKNSQVGIVAASMIDKEYRKERNGWKLHGFLGELLSMGPISRRLFRPVLQYRDSYFQNEPEWMSPIGRRNFQSKKAVYVDAVHGSMLMVDAEKFLQCGGYDEGIFLYQEEAVLGQRMKRHKYRTLLVLTEHYRHEHSVSISKSLQSQLERQRLREQSVLYYMKQYLHINPLQEVVAKLWFWGIRMEIRAAQAVGKLLDKCFSF